MLIVELVCELWLSEFAHFQLRNGITVLVDSINNFTSLSVTVWLDHSESSSSHSFKLIFRENISIINNLELSGMDSNNRSNIELLHFKRAN
jgi:hypothetical protein